MSTGHRICASNVRSLNMRTSNTMPPNRLCSRFSIVTRARPFIESLASSRAERRKKLKGWTFWTFWTFFQIKSEEWKNGKIHDSEEPMDCPSWWAMLIVYNLFCENAFFRTRSCRLQCGAQAWDILTLHKKRTSLEWFRRNPKLEVSWTKSRPDGRLSLTANGPNCSGHHSSGYL